MAATLRIGRQAPVSPTSVGSTLERERLVFIGLLRNDPFFLLEHAPALTRAVYRRMTTALAVRFKARHQGRKVWPRWLDADAFRQGQLDVSRGLMTVPDYPPVTRPAADEAVRGGSDENALRGLSEATDSEEVFAAHRWTFLVDSVLTGSPAAAVAMEECRQWISSNQDRTTAGWEPYSTCERVANLLIFLAADREARQMQVSMPEMLGFVDDSIRWIYRHLEYYGPTEGFNHILNNARVLVMAGAALGQDWACSAGMTIFRRCVPELIGPEGFLRERSSHYQLIVLNWMLDAWRFCAAYRGPDAEDAQFLRGYALRMASAAALFCDLAGPLISIGDVCPDAPPERSLRRLASLYPGSWPAAAPASLPPVQQRAGWIRITAGEEVLVAQFPRGNYPFGFLTHGHCDLTSFVWRHGPHEVLADPGRYRYTPDAVSLLQKSASGHNVVLVNGLAPVCETLVPNGQWWPLPYARAELEVLEHSCGVSLSHTGYARATPVTRHVRYIAAEGVGILVKDSFEGSGRAELTYCWQFGEQFDAFEADDLVAIGAGARVELSIEGAPGHAAVASAVGGETSGWLSREYGHKQPALTVRLRWLVDLPVVISTRFRFIACVAS